MEEADGILKDFGKSKSCDAAIIFDVLFVDPSREHPEGDRQLAQACAAAGNVFLIFELVASVWPFVTSAAVSGLGIPWCAGGFRRFFDGNLATTFRFPKARQSDSGGVTPASRLFFAM